MYGAAPVARRVRSHTPPGAHLQGVHRADGAHAVRCASSRAWSPVSLTSPTRIVAGVDPAVRAALSGRSSGCFRATRLCPGLQSKAAGVTVSAFLEANLLDRLQLAIAPVVDWGGTSGDSGWRRAPVCADCVRPAYRVFRMGGDVLFDYDLAASADASSDSTSAAPHVSRII